MSEGLAERKAGDRLELRNRHSKFLNRRYLYKYTFINDASQVHKNRQESILRNAIVCVKISNDKIHCYMFLLYVALK